MQDYEIVLKEESKEAIEYIKEGDECLGSVIQRSLQLLYYLKKREEEGYTQMFLRDPIRQRVMRVKHENR